MRHKICFFLLCLFLFFVDTFEDGVQGPPTDKRRTDDEEDASKSKEYISHVYDEDAGDVSALKIVPAPDLSKERDRRKGDGSETEESTESADILMIKQAKWLQKMVQEIGGIQYTIVSDNQEIEAAIDDEEAPPVLEPLPQKELTPEEIEGKIYYMYIVSFVKSYTAYTVILYHISEPILI